MKKINETRYAGATIVAVTEDEGGHTHHWVYGKRTNIDSRKLCGVELFSFTAEVGEGTAMALGIGPPDEGGTAFFIGLKKADGSEYIYPAEMGAESADMLSAVIYDRDLYIDHPTFMCFLPAGEVADEDRENPTADPGAAA